MRLKSESNFGKDKIFGIDLANGFVFDAIFEMLQRHSGMIFLELVSMFYLLFLCLRLGCLRNFVPLLHCVQILLAGALHKYTVVHKNRNDIIRWCSLHMSLYLV